jgi:hypothetical protein
MVGPHEYSHFGAQLAPAGDIDGDGLADVLVADNWNVYVIFGASDRALGRRSEVRVAAGYVPVMAAAGDIDGDGFGDIVVGDSAYNPSGRYGDYPGRALAFRGSADGLLPDPIWTVTGRPWVETDPHRPSDYVGAAIAAVGHGVVVGGRQLAYYPREDGGLASEPTWTPHETIVLPDGQGTLTPPFAAHAIALGDVTGDGIEDLVTSASHRLLMFPGTTAGFGDPAWDHQDTRANTIIAADLDGDGLGDIVAGDRILEHDEVYFQGYGYVHYYLSALSGLPAAASGTLEFALETGWYRASRALIGNAKAAADLDGDGSVELILGAPFDGDWGSTFERVYLPGRVLVFSVSP